MAPRASTVANPAIRQMILQRIDAIASDEPFDFKLHGDFVVVEVGDSLNVINTQIGFDVLSDRWTGLRYDHADYTPSFEILEAYETFFDVGYSAIYGNR